MDLKFFVGSTMFTLLMFYATARLYPMASGSSLIALMGTMTTVLGLFGAVLILLSLEVD
jgi:hypothetical protein